MTIKNIDELNETYKDMIVETFVDTDKNDMESWLEKFNDEKYPHDSNPSAKLQLANELFGGYGVEALRDENVWIDNYWQNTIALYVNMGDTYTRTIVYDVYEDKFIVTSWGDWCEKWLSNHQDIETEENLDEEVQKNFYLKSGGFIYCKHNKWYESPEEEKIKFFRSYNAAKKCVTNNHFADEVHIIDNERFPITKKEEVKTISADVNKNDEEKVNESFSDIKLNFIEEVGKNEFEFSVSSGNNVFAGNVKTISRSGIKNDERSMEDAINWDWMDAEEQEFFDEHWEKLEDFVKREITNYISSKGNKKVVKEANTSFKMPTYYSVSVSWINDNYYYPKGKKDIKGGTMLKFDDYDEAEQYAKSMAKHPSAIKIHLYFHSAKGMELVKSFKDLKESSKTHCNHCEKEISSKDVVELSPGFEVCRNCANIYYAKQSERGRNYGRYELGLEESLSSDYLEITTPIGSSDDKMFVEIVNQGIDPHLEGFTKSKFSVKDTSLGKRRVYNFHKDEISTLIRRLQEFGTEEAESWAYDIENYEVEED